MKIKMKIKIKSKIFMYRPELLTNRAVFNKSAYQPAMAHRKIILGFAALLPHL